VLFEDRRCSLQRQGPLHLVLFVGMRDDVIQKVPMDHVLIATERLCWPDWSMTERVGFDYSTPWCYANGGMFAGTPACILAWLNATEQHSYYVPNGCDQLMLNRLALERSTMFRMDTRTELFYCLPAETNDLQFDHGLPVNTLCGTHPNFIHISGTSTWDPIRERLERSFTCQ
jgi:hypothetical protein